MGYESAVRYLYGLQRHGIKLGLETPARLLSGFGDPQRGFKSAHVAGTNGKGSTAAILAGLLRASGKMTGLFTSPHLVSFTERISIDGLPIDEADVVSLADEVREKSGGLNPTFFEVVTVMGFLHFARMGVDWAVVETGLGGRLDATNVIIPEVSVITSLGIDHEDLLGHSPEGIAREKAGIIKSGVPVVSALQPGPIMEVLEEEAIKLGSRLYAFGRDFASELKGHGRGWVGFDYTSGGLSIKGLRLPLAGRHQAMNAALAIKAFELTGAAGGDIGPWVREGFFNLSWPGRLELVEGEPPVLIDGAHNPAAAHALAEALREDYLAPGEKAVFVIGVMADKDIAGILGPLLPLSSEVVFAAPSTGRSAPPRALAAHALEMGYASKTAGSVGEALEAARKSGEGALVVVTGSFYTAGEAMEALGKKGFLSGLREWRASA